MTPQPSTGALPGRRNEDSQSVQGKPDEEGPRGASLGILTANPKTRDIEVCRPKMGTLGSAGLGQDSRALRVQDRTLGSMNLGENMGFCGPRTRLRGSKKTWE